MIEMTDDEKRKQVKNFLKDFKQLIDEDRLFIKNRLVNRQALIELGLTDDQRKEELLSLSVLDFCSGPKPDQYRSGDYYWEFGKTVNEVEVYIKLQIAIVRFEMAICMSFHKATRPLIYPFKG